MPWPSAKKHQYVSFEVENNSLIHSVEFVLADLLAGLLNNITFEKKIIMNIKKIFTRTVQTVRNMQYSTEAKNL